MGMQNILNLYWMAGKDSTMTFMATNSVPKTDISIIDSFLEYQLFTDMYIQIMNLVQDLLVHYLQHDFSLQTFIDPPLSLLAVVPWVG